MISVKELAKKEGFELLTKDLEDKNIENVYISDMLSVVMAGLEENYAWLTIQEHLNVIAVAQLKDCACVITCEDIKVKENVLKKAIEEDVLILTSNRSIFDTACFIYEELKK